MLSTSSAAACRLIGSAGIFSSWKSAAKSSYKAVNAYQKSASRIKPLSQLSCFSRQQYLHHNTSRYYSSTFQGFNVPPTASEAQNTTNSEILVDPFNPARTSNPLSPDHHDSLLEVTRTQDMFSQDHEIVKNSVYKGFPKGSLSESEIVAFEHLERQASQTLSQATQSKDVYVIRELATQSRQLYEQYLKETQNVGATAAVLFNLGLVCGMLGDYTAQIECLHVALELDPAIIPAKRYLADAYQSSERHLEAIHYYDEYFNDFPRYYSRLVSDQGDIEFNGEKFNMKSEDILADVVFSRGRSYFALRKNGSAAAKEDFKAVIRLDGRHKANALYFMGILEHEGKDYWKAIKYFDLALQKGPATWFMYKGRSEAYRALGKEDRADEDERQADHLGRHRQWTHQVDQSIRMPEKENDVIQEYSKLHLENQRREMEREQQEKRKGLGL